MEDHARTTSEAAGASRFELAPPRRFVLPAILLLLTEQPGYGYSLEKDLHEFRFGHIDRPTVYRTLAQLEADGLVESWSEAPTAGHARRVYGVTPLGERVLRVWMSVIKEERDCLGRRPSPLPGHRYRRRRPGRGRRRLGGGIGIRLVARRDNRPPAASAGAGRRRPTFTNAGSATPASRSGHRHQQRPPIPPRPRSFGRDDRGALDGRPDQLRSPRRDRVGRGGTGGRCDPRRHANLRRDWRSRSTVCARETACTTPSCCVASAPGATRTSRSTSGLRGQRLREPLPVGRRAHLPRRDTTRRRHRERRGRVRTSARRHRRAGLRHPRLRRPLTDDADAPDLSRRTCPPSCRGRSRDEMRRV